MQTLVAEFTKYHAGFTCTAYLMADTSGALSIHTITRGQVLFGKSAPKSTTYTNALGDLQGWANMAPLY